MKGGENEKAAFVSSQRASCVLWVSLICCSGCQRNRYDGVIMEVIRRDWRQQPEKARMMEQRVTAAVIQGGSGSFYYSSTVSLSYFPPFCPFPDVSLPFLLLVVPS